MNCSQLSAMSVISIPAEIYSFGWQFALILPIISVITLVSSYLFLPVFYNNNIDNCYAVSVFSTIFFPLKDQRIGRKSWKTIHEYMNNDYIRRLRPIEKKKWNRLTSCRKFYWAHEISWIPATIGSQQLTVLWGKNTWFTQHSSFQYLELRFCKSVRNIVTVLYVLYGIFQMPIHLFIPSLAYSEGALERLCHLNISLTSMQFQLPDTISTSSTL